MSSISLIKDYEGQKKGAVISVPFLKGRELIASGVGKWHDAGSNMPKRPEPVVPEPSKPEPVVEPVKPDEPPVVEPVKQETLRRPRRNG